MQQNYEGSRILARFDINLSEQTFRCGLRISNEKYRHDCDKRDDSIH
jgi:hypothetical protein